MDTRATGSSARRRFTVRGEANERAVAACMHLAAQDLAKPSERLADGRLVHSRHAAETKAAVELSGAWRDLLVLQHCRPHR